MNVFDSILDNLSPDLRTPLLETNFRICSERLEEGMDYSYYLNEGIAEFKSVLRYAYNEFVEAVKELYKKLLRYLDTLVLHDFTYLKHYIDHIEKTPIEEFKDIKLRTYEYADLYKYPKNLTPPDITDVIKNSKFTPEAFSNFASKEYGGYVSAITGLKYRTKVSPSIIVEAFGKKLQGRAITHEYDIEHIREVIKTIDEYSLIKKKIKLERNEALDLLDELGRKAMMYEGDIDNSAKALAAQRMLQSSKETGRPLGKITYVEHTSDLEAQMAQKIFIASSFYKEMHNIVRLIYTVKVAKHKERYKSYRNFAQDVLNVISVHTKIAKSVKEAKRFKEIRELEMDIDKSAEKYRAKKIKDLTNPDPFVNLP